MNPTASLKRAISIMSGCLVFSCVTACVGTLAESGSSPSQDIKTSDIAGSNEARAAFDNSQLQENTSGSTSSRVLLSTDTSNAIGLELVDARGYNQLVVRIPEKATYEVSRLDSPSRLVLDIYGKVKSSSRVFSTPDAELVSSVRLGSYPDKSRLVLDLTDGKDVEHRVENMGVTSSSLAGIKQAGILVTLARSGKMETALADSAARFALERPLTEKTEKVASTAAVAPAKTSAETTSIAAVRKAAKEESPQLSSFEIQANGATDNFLVVQLSSDKALADLKQTAPSEYVLKLHGATLSENASATVLAPAGSGAIRSVRPVVQPDGVALRIFAAPEKKLTLSGGAGRITVAAEGLPISDELRAQLAPEKVAEKDAAAGETPADMEVSSLLLDQPKYTGRLISLDLQDTDIDNALRIIAEVSNLNIIASEDVTGKVTLRLNDVPWDQALDVILKTNGLDKVQEGNVIRIAPVEKLRQERESLKQAQQAEEDLEPLTVRYVRISYAKASELKPTVETVLTERGQVTYDERTNQLIIKDIKRGIKNVAELIAKLDLRTPQVLLETQIVESTRSMLRELGSEIGFKYVRSPATGNATGMNFPNAVAVGGSVGGAGGPASSFPAAVSLAGGSAVSMLLDSADGSKSLSARISALENEGRVKVISRPSVATANNKQATIKSVEKIRIKPPSGGLSVATGQGATANGTGTTATETVEIGITLEVVPQASPDYFVLLDINAKSSTFGSHVVDGVPSEVERSATSSVLVSSGQTFAMGGIYKVSDSNKLSGVPFLKDVPVIGHLFRWQQVDDTDEELLFFITPRIIEGSFDDAAMRANS